MSSRSGLVGHLGTRDSLGGHADRSRLGNQGPSAGLPAKGGLIGRPSYGRSVVARGSSSFLWSQPVSMGLPDKDRPVGTGLLG